MGYNVYLADRIQRILREKQVFFEERKMFGGLCFMVDGKMCAGIVNDQLMARIGPDVYDEVLQKSGVAPMDFTGRPMKGYVFVSAEAIDTESELEDWLQLCLDFNPKAKSSKKRSK